MSKLKCAKCGNMGAASEAMCTKCGTPYPVPEGAGQLLIIRKGQVVANRYLVLDMIGRGGMGAIYKVQDNTLGEIVALKTLLPEYVQEKLVVERFFNEARIARGLSHPNIVRVHDIGVTDGMAYISMELLAGRTLRAMMDKVEPGRRIPLNAILRMFDALCAALDYAHQFTIHRDIKPENVMVLPDGTVKLMDFGISKLMSNPNMTSASMVMGTPHYMSPEQLKNSANVDARADIYSVGIMLYEVLTGGIPTGISQSPENFQEVPPALDPIIAKCCHRDPAKRYSTVAELREKLREIRVEIETHSGATDRSGQKKASIPKPDGAIIRKGVACLIIIALVIAAYFGVVFAEQRRNDMIANAPIIDVIDEQIDATASAGLPDVDSFEAMRELVERARIRARAAMPGLKGKAHGIHASVLTQEADDLWEVVGSMVSGSDGLENAWPVLHRYMAVSRWPEGMVFIPGGIPEARVTGVDGTGSAHAFFIDAQEVSASEYKSFARDKKWRSAGGIKRGPYIAATNVTYYDAQAFLVSASIPKSLPTPGQWVLASESLKPVSAEREEETEEDEESYVSPWTSLVYEWLRAEEVVNKPEELFGIEMPVMRWDSSGYLSVDSMAFEGVDKNVGFRGVIEFPTTLKEAEAWIDR